MGRIKIKKKSGVIPFAQTLAYRMILVIVLVVAALVGLFLTLSYYRAEGFSPLALGWLMGTLIAAAAAYYNIERLKDARIPAATLKRMKRRP
ncbi:MAG TPA: hypothetical protein VFY29_02635 [Terriglobia bacterium]|nr:hypothetical protein [Terriglobia bacterium]